MHQHSGGEKQPQLQRLRQRIGLHGGLHIIEHSENFFRIQEQLLACLSGIELAVQPLKQRNPIVLLQLPDGLTHRGLGHIELLGCGGHAAGDVDVQKDFQVPGGHGLSSNPASAKPWRSIFLL